MPITIIESTNHDEIVEEIQKTSPTGVHCTNGTYKFEKDKFTPTTLAGFSFINEKYNDDRALLVAINSDKSMQSMNMDSPSQTDRANAVAEIMQNEFKDKKIIICFYDEKTPEALYEKLGQSKLATSLHKWGYGLTPNAPKIEGSSHFKDVFGFPLPHQLKAACHDITEKSDNNEVTVIDLRAQVAFFEKKSTQSPPTAKAPELVMQKQEQLAQQSMQYSSKNLVD